MNAAIGGGREAILGYLARHAASWRVLHTWRHRGLAAAAEALGTCGGVGRDNDGVFRSWFTEAGGRRITYRQGSTTVPPSESRCARSSTTAVGGEGYRSWPRG